MDKSARRPLLTLATDVLPSTLVPSGWFFSSLSSRTCPVMIAPSSKGTEGNRKEGGGVRALAGRPGTAGNTPTLIPVSCHTGKVLITGESTVL